MEFADLTWLEKAFFVFAVLGSSLFVIRLIIQFVVGGGDVEAAEADADLGSEGVHDGDLDDHADSDLSFKLLSFQGLTAFFMMFGWMGLAMSRNTTSEEWVCVLVAVGTGMFTVWVMDRMFAIMGKLQSKGNIRLEKAVGENAEVYLSIPENGTGKIQLNIDNRLSVVDAVSDGPVTIPTGQRVKVIRITNGVMVVQPEHSGARDQF